MPHSRDYLGQRFRIRTMLTSDVGAPAPSELFLEGREIFPRGSYGTLEGYRVFRHAGDPNTSADIDAYMVTPEYDSGAVPGGDVEISSITDEIDAGTIPADGKTTTVAATFDLGANGRVFDGLVGMLHLKTTVTAGPAKWSIIAWGWVKLPRGWCLTKSGARELDAAELAELEARDAV